MVSENRAHAIKLGSELFRCHLSVLLTGEIARLEDRGVKALAVRGAKVARLEVDATVYCLIALR